MFDRRRKKAGNIALSTLIVISMRILLLEAGMLFVKFAILVSKEIKIDLIMRFETFGIDDKKYKKISMHIYGLC